MSKRILVYENFSDTQPKKMGTLYVDDIRNSEVYSFEYDEDWLDKSEYKVSLDPNLQLTKGRQYSPSRELFGIFKDISPDRWGQTLMNRKEKINAKKEERVAKKLTSSDYLLGVHDKTRMGAIRLKLDVDGNFISNDEVESIPPWTTLRTLENASREFECSDDLNETWLKELLLPGSSLGGARPKAVVMDPNDELWIAKFPSKKDEYDIGKWECIAYELAKLCGLNVSLFKLEKFSDLGSTFIVKRFDREKDRRIHFASAMTLLGEQDGTDASSGASYLDLVSFIKTYSCTPKKDLLELYKRIVFNMAIRNTDDHLRNHGFLLTKKGWKLSPLYDINPTNYGERLSLNVNGTDNSISTNLLLESATYFDIEQSTAIEIIEEIKKTVKENWEIIAKNYKLNRNEIESMKNAFAFCNE